LCHDVIVRLRLCSVIAGGKDIPEPLCDADRHGVSYQLPPVVSATYFGRSGRPPRREALETLSIFDAWQD
jgi:hypothetical protein